MGERIPTVAAALDEWFERELRWRPASTRRTYRSTLNRIGSDKPIASFDLADCYAFLDSYADNSIRTVSTAYGALASFLKWCCRRGYLPGSPLAAIAPPKVRPKEHHVFTRDELHTLWAEAWNAELRLILLLLGLGLRVNELVSLRWTDIEPDGTISVLFTKGDRPRQIAAHEAILQLLGEIPRTDARILPISTQAVRGRLQRLGRRARVPNVHPHRFRHTWAVSWLLETNDAHTLQTLGGWANDNMVRHYARTALQRSALKKARDVDLRLFD